MKLWAAAILLALGMTSMTAACSQGRGRTIELPGGVNPDEQPRQESGGWFSRGSRQNVGPCPLMGVLYESSRLVNFAAPDNQRYANIAYTGEVENIRGLCRYLDADPITMSVEIDMAFGRGPAATADRQTYRYWVAVTRRGMAPIEKAYFDVDVRWENGQTVVNRTEEINRIVIPRANPDTSGENFEVLVGFELTPEQLQFNRDGRRFRIDAATRAAGAN